MELIDNPGSEALFECIEREGWCGELKNWKEELLLCCGILDPKNKQLSSK